MALSEIVMFDGTDPSQFPVAPAAVAGYVAGRWPDFRTLTVMFPRARALSIAVSADQDAECLDIETGDARPEDAPGWCKRQQPKVARPCLYASVDLMQAEVIPVLKAAGIPRAAVRLWTAHYAGKHICGPSTCAELAIPADGTQWTDRAFGRPLDQSLLAAEFFAVPAPAPKPPPPSVPAWQEAMMQALPDVRQGDAGEVVRTIQGLCIARGYLVAVDGSFGPATHEAVTAVQAARHLTADGVVGPATWPVLVGL